MEKLANDRLSYQWPAKEDVSWEKTSHILKVCQTQAFVPEKSTNRYQLYKFSAEDIAKAQSKFAEL